MTPDPTISLYVYNTIEADRDRYRGALEEIRHTIRDTGYPDDATMLNRVLEILDEYLPLEAAPDTDEPTVDDIPF